MTDPEHLTPGARRILEVASDLFYRRGIHAVGVDTIAAESGVTKRTLYDRFGSKDRLVVTYLAARDRRWRELIATRAEATDPRPVAQALVPFDVLPEWLTPGGRGCSFLNAFAELPDPDHPGHQMIVAEKTWLRSFFHDHLARAGVPSPEVLAAQMTCLHEGAVISCSVLGDTTAPATARQAAADLLEGRADPG